MADEIRNDDVAQEGAKQELKGMGRELKGKVQKNLGKLTDDKSEELKGRVNEGVGKVQKNVGREMQK